MQWYAHMEDRRFLVTTKSAIWQQIGLVKSVPMWKKSLFCNLSVESSLPRSANKQDDARSDIRAKGLWNRQHCAYFDVRGFHPNAPSYHSTNIQALYTKHEQAKKSKYGDRVREVEYASFTPLASSTTGGLGKETSVAYKGMAELSAIKRKTE